MQLVGGELLINSELGLGTTISARVPTEVEHQQARAAGWSPGAERFAVVWI